MGMRADQVRSGEGHAGAAAEDRAGEEAPARVYRVEYQAAAGDGHVLVSTAERGTPSLVTYAHDLLLKRGIDARIRRIVPVAREA
jgi:hypothetical protein